MTLVRIKATLADGRTLIGPIGGAGGMLGAGVPDHRAADYAMKRIRGLQQLVPNGSIQIFPDHSAAGDGNPIRIPLNGTDFEVLP